MKVFILVSAVLYISSVEASTLLRRNSLPADLSGASSLLSGHETVSAHDLLSASDYTIPSYSSHHSGSSEHISLDSHSGYHEDLKHDVKHHEVLKPIRLHQKVKHDVVTVLRPSSKHHKGHHGGYGHHGGHHGGYGHHGGHHGGYGHHGGHHGGYGHHGGHHGGYSEHVDLSNTGVYYGPGVGGFGR